jgi:hypothetical protein
MAFTFEWAPQKATRNARKYGISIDEAAMAFGIQSASSLLIRVTLSRSIDLCFSAIRNKATVGGHVHRAR